MTKEAPTASRVPRLTTLPLVGGAAASLLGGLFYYLDHHAPYREIQSYPKDKIEDYCLWLAAVISALSIVHGAILRLLIRRSAARLKEMYRVALGIALNLLTLAAILLVLFLRSLITAH